MAGKAPSPFVARIYGLRDPRSGTFIVVTERQARQIADAVNAGKMAHVKRGKAYVQVDSLWFMGEEYQARGTKKMLEHANRYHGVAKLVTAITDKHPERTARYFSGRYKRSTFPFPGGRTREDKYDVRSRPKATVASERRALRDALRRDS